MNSWKTTIIGCLLAGFSAYANYSGPATKSGYVVSVGLAILGLLAKDFDVHVPRP